MAVNQAQVDHIISTASADDPEVKLQKLQDEVDLIKVSIKRLLIDIRERMNELENPFAGASAHSTGQIGHATTAEAREEAAAAREAAAAAREAAAAARDTKLEKPDADVPKSPSPASETSPVPAPAAPVPAVPAVPERRPETAPPPRPYDEHLLETLRAQLLGQTPKEPVERQKPIGPEKIRLQKVHRLFEWTSKTAKKYGHDRLEMMCESYRAMGYISKESVEQVREIARLMPSSIGECHEIGPDEFVAELYTLNRILDPNDTTLDRDMIEVLMEQKHRTGTGPIGVQVKEKDSNETWVHMQDRT